MQSSTALARCESVRFDNEWDLTKVDEETFPQDLLVEETALVELATFAPSFIRNLTGDKIGSLCNLNVQVSIIFFLFVNTLPQPSFGKMVGFSLTSGLKHTLLLFLNI